MSHVPMVLLVPMCTGLCRVREVHEEGRQGRSSDPISSPALPSHPSFSNPGEHSSLKDEISLDSFTPES
jgi:hypothetical protein